MYVTNAITFSNVVLLTLSVKLLNLVVIYRQTDGQDSVSKPTFLLDNVLCIKGTSEHINDAKN